MSIKHTPPLHPMPLHCTPPILLAGRTIHPSRISFTSTMKPLHTPFQNESSTSSGAKALPHIYISPGIGPKPAAGHRPRGPRL